MGALFGPFYLMMHNKDNTYKSYKGKKTDDTKDANNGAVYLGEIGERRRWKWRWRLVKITVSHSTASKQCLNRLGQGSVNTSITPNLIRSKIGTTKFKC